MNSKAAVASQILIAVLVPVVTALLGAAGVVFQDWRTRRSDVGRRKLAVDDARAQVTFVTQWWNAGQSLGQSPEAMEEVASRATALLENASSVVSATQLPSPRPQPPLTIRRLVLLYPFHSLEGKVVRVAFYFCSGLTVMALGASISQRLIAEANGDRYLNGFLIVGGMAAALALALRFLAAGIEENAESATSHGEAGRGFTRRMLLFYSFHRRWAKSVRILFYAGLLCVLLYVRWCIQQMVSQWTLVWLPVNLAGLLVYGAAALGVRSWAVSLERAVDRTPVPHRTSDPPAVANQPDHQPSGPTETPIWSGTLSHQRASKGDVTVRGK